MPNMTLLWLGVYLSVVLGSKYKQGSSSGAGGGKHHSQIHPLSGQALDAESEKQRSSDHATGRRRKSRRRKMAESPWQQCTKDSACGTGSQNVCSKCQACFKDAAEEWAGVGDASHPLRNLPPPEYCPALYDYIDAAPLSLKRCFDVYPQCSGYVFCRELRSWVEPFCPQFWREQCEECTGASLLLASRASGASNASTSPADDNACGCPPPVSLIQGSNMEKSGLEDDLDSVYERKGCR